MPATGRPASAPHAPARPAPGRPAAAQPERPAETMRFRQAFRRVPAPVAVLLVHAEGGGILGLTCTSAASLSADPPMAVVCVDDKTGVTHAIRQAGRFSVNFLAADRAEWAHAFSSRGRRLDALAGVVGTGRTEVPVLRTGTTSVLECGVAAIHSGGDHWIVCGLVSHARFQADTEPLIYLAGRYGVFAGDPSPLPPHSGG
ncbi:MAG TPA: flavin reductase family protein [Streptosporangiaceae bacterium]